MKIYGKCKRCKSEIAYKTDAHTRVEFAMQDGDTKKLSCSSCGTTSEYQVDELYAKPSNMPLIIVGLLFLTGMIILAYQLFFPKNPYVIIMFGLPIGIFFTLKKQDRSRVSNFNRRKLKGRTHTIV